jgi:purine nucleosidase
MLKEPEISQIRELNSKLGNFSVDIQKVLIDLTKEWYDFYGFDLPDPITMAIALENSIIEESQDCHVIVDTRDGITRGQTIVDYFNVEGKNQNVRVVTKSSNKKFMSLLLDLLR